MSDFGIFWAVYPKRVAKKDAEKAWKRLTSQQKVAAMEALPKHIEKWADPEFIPYPASWLNGERWEDVLEPAIKPKVTLAWWSSDQGTLDYGAKVGVPAKPGETMANYRQRLKGAA